MVENLYFVFSVLTATFLFHLMTRLLATVLDSTPKGDVLVPSIYNVLLVIANH